MRQSLFWGHLCEARHGSLAEGTAGGGEDEALHFALFAGTKALVDGVVLAIHRQKRHVVALDRGHYHFAGCHEDFLVRQRDVLALFDGLVGCGQTDDSDSGGKDGVRVRMRGDEFNALGTKDNLRLVTGLASAALKIQCGTQLACSVFGADRNEPGSMARCLFGGQGNIRPSGERDYLEVAWEGVNYAETLAPDGACRAQDGDALHAASILTGD